MTEDSKASDQTSLLVGSIPFIISIVVVINFLLQMVFLAKGNFTVAQLLVSADPVKVGLGSTLSLIPLSLMIFSTYSAANIVRYNIGKRRRQVWWALLLVTCFLSLYLAPALTAIFSYAQAVVILLVGAYSRAWINRILPYRYKRKTDTTEVSQALRLFARHTSRWRLRNLVYVRLLTTVDGALITIFVILRRRFSLARAGPAAARALKRINNRLDALKNMQAISYDFRMQTLYVDDYLTNAEVTPPQARHLDSAPSALLVSAVVNLTASTILFLTTYNLLPVQNVSFSNGEIVSAFVVANSTPTTTILVYESRRVLTVRTADIERAEPCYVRGRGLAAPAEFRLAHPIIWNPVYLPRCK